MSVVVGAPALGGVVVAECAGVGAAGGDGGESAVGGGGLVVVVVAPALGGAVLV